MISILDENGHIDALSPAINDPDFCEEKEACKAEVLSLLRMCEEIAAAPDRTAALGRAASMRGLHKSKVTRLFYAWLPRRFSDGWRELVNRSKYRDPAGSALPPAFRGFWKDLYESHQREGTAAQAKRILVEMLSAWERDPLNGELAIPGYAEPPRREKFTGLPRGWSRLDRLCSNKYERAMRRQGPKAASEFLPSLYTSRVGLEFFQLLYFDDQWHDTKINLTGKNRIDMRPQSFNAMECLTGSAFEVGLKPQIWDEEKSKRTELNHLDFFWFVMLILTKYGYNPRGKTFLVMEHGGANVDKTGVFDELLLNATSGCVAVDRSGLWRAPAFKEMLFEGRSTGNFRFKAPLESFFNLLRNWSSGLKGATGRNPESEPEENYGLAAYNRQLQKLIDVLPQDAFMRLARPVIEWEDYTRVHRAIMRTIDRREDHALEGWKKLRFTGQRYLLGGHWIEEHDWLKIPDAERRALTHIVSQPGNYESYPLSPATVFERHMAAGSLRKLPMHVIPQLAPKRAWDTFTVRDTLEIEIVDQQIDSEPLRYYAVVRNSRGLEMHLERGKTYKRLLNVFDPSQLWIADMHGAFLGVAAQVLPPCKIDHAGILTQLGELGHIESLQSKAVKTRMEGAAADRVEMYKANKQIIDTAGASPEQLAQARAAARIDAKAAAAGAALRGVHDEDQSSAGAVQMEEW